MWRGGFHSCALDLQMAPCDCWGRNLSGQSAFPSDLGTVISISAGGEHTCVLSARGASTAGVEMMTGKPRHQMTLDTPSMSAGGYHTCALLRDGTVRCWGRTIGNQLEVPLGLESAVSTFGR